MELGKAIKLIRTASGMKQKQIAGSLGVTSNYLSLVENGKREPSVSFLKRLADVLGVPVGLFFLWEPANTPQSQDTIEQVRGLLAALEAMRLSASQPIKRKRRRAA
ncbi:MAG TPA: helix-turn-helix transcriptional regulator [Candidatus Acidoferrales bacterium]|nr:helix-turn-helix transcriptional regulator [Candidatus Acidoferrales bacterium]